LADGPAKKDKFEKKTKYGKGKKDYSTWASAGAWKANRSALAAEGNPDCPPVAGAGPTPLVPRLFLGSLPRLQVYLFIVYPAYPVLLLSQQAENKHMLIRSFQMLRERVVGPFYDLLRKGPLDK